MRCFALLLSLFFLVPTPSAAAILGTQQWIVLGVHRPGATPKSVATLQSIWDTSARNRYKSASFGQYDPQGTVYGDYEVPTSVACGGAIAQNAVDQAFAEGKIFPETSFIALINAACGDSLSLFMVSVDGHSIRGFSTDKKPALVMGYFYGLPPGYRQACDTTGCTQTFSPSACCTWMSDESGYGIGSYWAKTAGWIANGTTPISTATSGQVALEALDLPWGGVNPKALVLGNFYIEARQPITGGKTVPPPAVLAISNLNTYLDFDHSSTCVMPYLPLGSTVQLTSTLSIRLDAATTTTDTVSILPGDPTNLTAACSGKGTTTTTTDSGGTKTGGTTTTSGTKGTPPPTHLSFADLSADLRGNEAIAYGFISGVNALFHSAFPTTNVTAKSLLNWEHVVGGTVCGDPMTKDKCMWFTPRSGPMPLTVVNDHCVQLTRNWQDEPWKVGAVITYCLTADHYIDVDAQFTPMDVSLFQPYDYMLIFFADYMAGAQEVGIHFKGITGPGAEPSWVYDAATDTTSGKSYRYIEAPPLQWDPANKAPYNYVSPDYPRYTRPFFFGLLTNGLVYGLMFDHDYSASEQIRPTLMHFLTNKQTAPPYLPAWDWQYIVQHPQNGVTYGFKARAFLEPYTNNDAIEGEYDTWKANGY